MRKWKTEDWQLKILLIIMIGVLLMILVPLFMIAHYNFRSVDDFGYAKEAELVWEESKSVCKVFWAQIAYTWDYYLDWQGTFFGEWLATSVMGIFSKNAYYMCTYLNLGGFVIAELIAFMTILVKGLGADKARAGIISIGCICLQVLLTPVPVEAYYWFCGAMLYTFIHAMAWILVTLLVLFYLNDGKSKKIKILQEMAILFFTIAIGGSNYITSLTILLVYAFYVAWMLYRKHPQRVWAVCNAVIYIVVFLANVLAPGNRNRQVASGVEPMSALESIVRSLDAAAEYVLVNMIPPCIILGILFVPLFVNIVKKKNYRYPLPVLVSLISFGVFAAQFTPNLYALQITGAGRAQNLYRFNYYVWFFGNELYWIGWLYRRYRERQEEGCLAKEAQVSYLLPGWLLGGLLLCVSLHFWGGKTITTKSAVDDLRSGVAKQYFAEYQERLILLEDASITEVYMKPFSVKPYLLFFGDIVEDTDDWVNRTVANYFGKEKVGLIPSE